MSGLKKGPWTKAEDAILVEYVRKHGEGNWNAVQKNSGLLRCGKSCRLRWTNHLRPNLKKGSFSRDEVLLILRLHAQLGNKWARMAAQLPGRTDNEIKNYWNTRIKKRIKAGLPLCPPEIQPPEERSSSATTPPSTPSGSLAEATSSSSQFPMPPNPIDFTATPPPPPPFLTHHYFSPASLSFSSSSPVSSPSAAGLFKHSLRNYELSAMVAHHPVPELSPFSVNSELPSTQLFPEPLGLGRDGSSDQSRNTGLLDTLLQEPKGLSTLLGVKPQELPLDDQELKIASLGSLGHRDEQLEPLEGRGKGGGAHPWEPGRDSGHVSEGEEFGMKPKKQPTDEINPVHGDLSMLLDMIPTVSMPRTTMFPDWYNGDSREIPYGKSSGVNNDGLELELQQLASSLSVKPEDNEWTIGSCLWNNMPNIC